MTDKESVARSTGQHADHSQPHVGDALRRISPETDAQHV